MMASAIGYETSEIVRRTVEASEAARKAEHAIFDAAEVAERVWYWELAVSDWRLREEAECRADFYRHSGHEPEDTRLEFYDQTREAIGQLFPPDYALPNLDWFVDGDGLPELVRQGLRDICSYEGDSIRAIVGRDGDTVTTIEAALDECRCAIVAETPLHVFCTTADGSRNELMLLVPERGDEYANLAWLLDECADTLAEAEDARYSLQEGAAN